MPISFECDHCGKSYRVKDEAAGKRFRCKECSSPLEVPSPDEDEFLAEVSEDDWEDYADDDFAPAQPTRRSRPKPSPKKKKRKRRKSSSAGVSAGKIVLIVGGVLGVLFVGFVGVGVFQAVKVVMNPEWKEFSPPGVDLKAMMPGSPKPKTNFVGMVTEYNFVAETPRYACNLTYVSMPPNSAIDREAGYDGAKQGKLRSHPEMRVVGERDITHAGRSGREIEYEDAKLHLVVRIYFLNDVICGQEFITKKGSPRPDEMKKFFDSMKFGRHAGGGDGVAPNPQTSAIDDEPYLHRRVPFQTKLTRSEPAPQESEADIRTSSAL